MNPSKRQIWKMIVEGNPNRVSEIVYEEAEGLEEVAQAKQAYRGLPLDRDQAETVERYYMALLLAVEEAAYSLGYSDGCKLMAAALRD